MNFYNNTYDIGVDLSFIKNTKDTSRKKINLWEVISKNDAKYVIIIYNQNAYKHQE